MMLDESNRNNRTLNDKLEKSDENSKALVAKVDRLQDGLAYLAQELKSIKETAVSRDEMQKISEESSDRVYKKVNDALTYQSKHLKMNLATGEKLADLALGVKVIYNDAMPILEAIRGPKKYYKPPK